MVYDLMNFAECWKKYLKKHRLSYRKVAEICGIIRTLAAQYADGKNKPQNENSVCKIIESLQATDEEARELLTSYRISCYGKKEYYARKFLDKIRPLPSNLCSGGGGTNMFGTRGYP